MYDVLIKNGRTVEGNSIEIAIQDGVIKKVKEQVIGEAKRTIYLDSNSFVSAGWIDSHVHCFEKMDLYYDFPDEIGVSKGVTTVIDAGSTGADNIGEFYDLVKSAKTNVRALINISESGIVFQDELSDITKIRKDLVEKSLADYPDFIVGIKARMSASVVGDNGIIPLEMAKDIQKDNAPLPLMVHIGSAPPVLSEILNRLDKGDIITHCFNGKENGILNKNDEIKDFVWEAYNKGVVFDIGHGTDSFNFHVAEIAWQEKMIANTISTDIYHRNRETGPVHDLATTMNKLVEIGYSLPSIIEKVTAKPAEYFHLSSKGRLLEGMDGDITIFRIEKQVEELIDSNGNKRVASQAIIPEKAVIGGIVYDID